MPLDERKYAALLDEFAAELDIPASKYKEAVQRYEAVGNWLNSGKYEGCEGKEPRIYPQGSFRIGTVIRPIRNSEESDYDIDLVSELPIDKSDTCAEYTKSAVGDRIKSHGTYIDMLEDEGRRCWTLNYAEQDGIGFHLDVLPGVPENGIYGDTSIAITHRDDAGYRWSSSNPIGYANWFDERNRSAFLVVERTQKFSISAQHPTVYASVDAVPDQLVRTPLQRAIQIMKRHRDTAFDNADASEYRPISMIITTLAAQLYAGEADVFSALKNITQRLHAHAALLKGQGILNEHIARGRLIERSSSGEWLILNPVNPNENFADRWHEDGNARAIAFFDWVEKINHDLIEIITSYDRKAVRTSLVVALGAKFVNQHFEKIWPLTNPKPSATTTKVHIAQGQKPWRDK